MNFLKYFQEKENPKMKNKFYTICIIFMTSVCLFGQNDKDSLSVIINAKWNENPFKLSTSYISKNKDTLKITQLKFYVSDFQVVFEDKTTFTDKASHLVDFEKPNSTIFPISKNNKKKIIGVNFCIGVDSLASVSGALSGDLDPSNGMYWAWQSGYINMKIEGKSPSCKTRKNEFQFHIGGYMQPYYAMQEIEMPISKSQIPNQIDVAIDLGKFFSEIHLKETNSVMFPGKEAMKLANYFTKMFYAK